MPVTLIPRATITAINARKIKLMAFTGIFIDIDWVSSLEIVLKVKGLEISFRIIITRATIGRVMYKSIWATLPISPNRASNNSG